MAYSENDKSLIDFYTSMLTLHQEAQNRVNSVFEGLKHEAMTLLHKSLFSRPKLMHFENEDLKESINQSTKNVVKESKKDKKDYNANKEYGLIKKENEENEEKRWNKESKEYEEIKEFKENEECIVNKTIEDDKATMAPNSLPVKRLREAPEEEVYHQFLDEYKPKIAERKEMICKLYSSNVSPKLIGRLLSLSVNAIHIIGDWKQVSLKIAQRNRETRQKLKKLLSDGHPFQEVVKHSGLNNTTASVMLDDYPICIVIKSPEEKKNFIEKAVNNCISKKLLARVTRIQPSKIYTWANHLNNDEDFSDEECIEDKSGEYSRETIRKTIYDYYLNNSIEGAAERNGVSNLVKIEEWIRNLENLKKHRRDENGFE
ncbi:unnamed protein product [Blepharisma stoltei]|uniref:HNH homing endonuclease n=1 Tax=Blepharisma stoltei TaxID=1481888 RepID=A0AAU9K1C0_9CILI|nr:unnamed protein product [Blepharisma stoltei]